MDETMLAGYIKRRLDAGDPLSEIKLSLIKSGYTKEQIQKALIEEEKEEPIALNTKAFKKSLTGEIFKILKIYSKVFYGIIIIIALWTLISKLVSMEFNSSDLKISLIVGVIYVTAMSLLIVIMSILIFSLHKATKSHTANQLYYTKNLLAITIGEIFTAILVASFSTIPIYFPIIVGAIIFILLMRLFVGSTINEVVASFVTFLALTIFYYMLIAQVYTKEIIVGLLL